MLVCADACESHRNGNRGNGEGIGYQLLCRKEHAKEAVRRFNSFSGKRKPETGAEGAAGGGQAKKKQKKAGPKGVMSAYFCFTADVRERVTQQNPGMQVFELSKVMGEEWRALGEDKRKKYADLSAEDRARFRAETAAWAKEHPDPVEPSAQKRKPPQKRKAPPMRKVPKRGRAPKRRKAAVAAAAAATASLWADSDVDSDSGDSDVDSDDDVSDDNWWAD